MKKKIDKQIQIAQLLAGKVLDSLNDEQKIALSEWEKSDENSALEKAILNEAAFNKWSNSTNKVDVSENWNAFQARLNDTKPAAKVVKMQWYKVVASIAAVLLVGLTFYLSYQKYEPGKTYQTLAEANIEPGSAQAQLILNNGEVVKLEEKENDRINEGNLAISNKNGLLAYDESNKKQTIRPVVNTLKIPKGGEYQLVLPDGTKVWLNSDSELKYSIPFSGNERRVSLTGEAYFDVTPDKSKPFIVETEKQDVIVLGTEFNVSAYSEDLNIVTTLVEGKVKVEPADATTDKEAYFLLPNEQLVWNKETEDVQKKDVETYTYTAWKDGRFAFKNEPLDSFLKKISRWYNVETYITDESVKDIRFTGDLPRYKKMQDILKILEIEMSVHIEIEDNKIIYVSK